MNECAASDGYPEGRAQFYFSPIGIVPFRIVVKSPQYERPCHEGCKYRVSSRGGSLKLKFGGSGR